MMKRLTLFNITAVSHHSNTDLISTPLSALQVHLNGKWPADLLGELRARRRKSRTCSSAFLNTRLVDGYHTHLLVLLPAMLAICNYSRGPVLELLSDPLLTKMMCCIYVEISLFAAAAVHQNQAGKIRERPLLSRRGTAFSPVFVFFFNFESLKLIRFF